MSPRGPGDYLALHNVACVYATPAKRDPQRAAEFDALALEVLRRGVELGEESRNGPDARG